MRVSDTQLSQSFLRNTFASKKKMERLQNELTTGSKINKPSDSPAGAAKLMRMNSTIKSSESFQRNIAESLATLRETSDALEGMLKEVNEVRALFTELENPVNNQYPESYAKKIQFALDSILNSANKEYNGKYLFGGTDFTAKPFGYTADKSAIELKVPDVSGEQKVKISGNLSQKVNISGEELFGTIGATDVFNALKKIVTDLESGALPDEADKQLIENFHGTLLDKTSESGIYINRLEDSKELLDNRIITLKELMSEETEVDVVETMIDLEHQDYLLQLAYKTSSMILPKSLVDYL